jgi:hypothetical protein
MAGDELRSNFCKHMENHSWIPGLEREYSFFDWPLVQVRLRFILAHGIKYLHLHLDSVMSWPRLLYHRVYVAAITSALFCLSIIMLITSRISFNLSQLQPTLQIYIYNHIGHKDSQRHKLIKFWGAKRSLHYYGRDCLCRNNVKSSSPTLCCLLSFLWTQILVFIILVSTNVRRGHNFPFLPLKQLNVNIFMCFI